MKISNDNWVKSKYLATSLVFFVILNIFFWIAFRDYLSSPAFLVSGFILLYVSYMVYLMKVRKCVNNVHVNENTISYEIGGHKNILTKEEIQSFGDTGHTRVPYEVVIYLKNGKTVDFFPIATPSSFKESDTLAMLKSWLASNSRSQVN